MRTPKFDWEAHKDQLLELRYTQGKSLNEITKIVYEKTGIAYTAARVSQVFKGWKTTDVQPLNVEEPINENRSN